MSDIKNANIVPGPIGSPMNRGMDNAITSNDPPQIEITLERINSILMDYLTNTIRPSIVENDSNRTVPIQYASAERWVSIRKEGFVRDEGGKILCPLILMHRKSIKRGQLINPNNKYLYTTITQEWNKKNAYDRFNVLNQIRPSQQVRHVMIPDYVDLEYEFIMWTDYTIQMDKIIEQLNTENEDYWGNRNDFKFRVKIESYETEDTVQADDDRLNKTTFSMSVAAYLLPDRVVQNMKISSTDTKLYTAKKVISMVESVKNINDINEK